MEMELIISLELMKDTKDSSLMEIEKAKVYLHSLLEIFTKDNSKIIRKTGSEF